MFIILQCSTVKRNGRSQILSMGTYYNDLRGDLPGLITGEQWNYIKQPEYFFGAKTPNVLYKPAVRSLSRMYFFWLPLTCPGPHRQQAKIRPVIYMPLYRYISNLLLKTSTFRVRYHTHLPSLHRRVAILDPGTLYTGTLHPGTYILVFYIPVPYISEPHLPSP